MPVELQLTFADATTQLYKFPVEIWYKGDRYTALITADKAVKDQLKAWERAFREAGMQPE